MSLSFFEVATVFQDIEHTSSRLEITDKLSKLYKQASPQEAQIITYLSLGMLFPPYKSVQFNIAKKSMLSLMQDLYVDVCVQDVVKQSGDLGSAWVVLHQNNKALDVHYSLQEVYETLQACAYIEGTGSTKKRAEIIQNLLQAVDALVGKFIIRIITKTLRLGFSDMTIIDALSWMYTGDKSLRSPLEHAYNMCADLGLVACVLKESGLDVILHLQPRIGIPLRPSAAERLHTAKAIIDKLGTCAAQSKLDGFRLQVHVDKREGRQSVHFFSRNLQDMTPMFPDLKSAFLQLPVETLICEGEAIVFDDQQGYFLPFQQTVKRKRKHGIEQASQDFPLRFYAFDVLYTDGILIFDQSHEKRRSLLTSLFDIGMQQYNLFAIPETIVSKSEDLEKVFYTAINEGLEGLVVKRIDAPYVPGKRNFNWVKYKREETQVVDDTIDVVVLGYYFGSGKRAAFGIGAFLVGVYNSEQDTFESIAKVGTGLSDIQWRALKEKCDGVTVDQQPKQVVVAKDLLPDQWVYPEIVCVVRADEITQSPLHTAGAQNQELGFALRFPRFIEYRTDKSPTDATTVKEVKHLYSQQFSL